MIKTGHHLSDAEIAALYDSFQGELSMRPYFYTAVAQFIGSISHQTVLDVGCGSGQLLATLQQRFPQAELKGFEMSQANVAAAKARLGEAADIRLGNILGAVPFPPACADVVVVTEVVEHLKDPIAALRNVRSLVKPDGVLIITIPNGTAWLPLSPIAERLARRFRPLRGFLPHEHPLRTEQPIDTVFTYAEIKSLLRMADLKVEKAVCRETFPYVAELFYKFLPRVNIFPIWAKLDALVTRLGLLPLGYRLFFRCRLT